MRQEIAELTDRVGPEFLGVVRMHAGSTPQHGGVPASQGQGLAGEGFRLLQSGKMRGMIVLQR